jgi:uncharacterized protein YgiM (DUF1202 family)
MKTFILLTFGFLGFAFYQMSGGADFEPASARVLDTTPDAPAPEQTITTAVAGPAVQPSAMIDTANIAKISSTPDVTRAALNLTSVNEPEDPAPEPVRAQIIDSADTPRIILPSLIAGPDTYSTTLDGDIRSVSANRVNVRGGPSTNYGVVSKLERGAEVLILEDTGTGWVRMQPLDGGQEGWMADFLLTAG